MLHMKASKTIGGLALGLIVLAILVGYFFVSNLDGLIKSAVERLGSDVTQTQVSLDGVKIDLSSGKGQLSGLTIANPDGYDSDYVLKLDDIVLAIAPASLNGPVIVISEITIDGAKLIAEQKGATTNLSDLLANVESASKSGESTPASAEGEETRLMVEKFVFINTTGTFITEQSEEKSIEIPDVRRSNIGDKTVGLTPEQLTEEIMNSVVASVEKAVGQYLGGLAADAAEKKLTEKMSAEDKSTFDGIKSIFKKD
jgi:hypothetical protein